MNWWQLLILCAVILLVGFWVAVSLRDSLSLLGRGLTPLEKLGEYFGWITQEIADEKRVTEERMEQIEKCVREMGESLKAIQAALSDPNAAAQHVRLIRDEVKRLDEEQKARKSWEETRQKEHEAWERAARMEADRLGKEGKP